MQKPQSLKTSVFLDSGNPDDTRKALEVLGFLDGQTTNPSLVAKNPHIQELKNGEGFTADTIWQTYKKVALEVHDIIPQGSVSVEVYADDHTDFESMLSKAHELSVWFPDVYVKLPVTLTGLKVAAALVKEGIRVNMTLCFSQEQAAAVHMATIGASKGQVYVSPFIGRLDDKGLQGLDVIENIIKMYKEWDSHVFVLGASIRNLDHLFGCFNKDADIVTVPLSVLEEWKEYGLEKKPSDYVSTPPALSPIVYHNLEQKDYTSYNIQHDLTDSGILKFSSDWKDLLNK